jgi:hypothetical protein
MKVSDTKRKQILECLLSGWIEDGMPLYGCLSYNDVKDFMTEYGVDAKSIDLEIESRLMPDKV